LWLSEIEGAEIVGDSTGEAEAACEELGQRELTRAVRGERRSSTTALPALPTLTNPDDWRDE
jgi:hypothetical protein